MKNAAKRGTKLVLADPRRSDLARHAWRYLQFKPDTDVAMLNAMIYTIIEEGLVDEKFIADRTSGYDALKEMGVNRVSFCFEIFDPERFRETCPGKHREYGLQRYLDAIAYCAELGRRRLSRTEPWVTNGEIIAGLEPPESSIRAIDWITSVGAIPTVCVFRPLVGTDLQDAEPPKTADMVPVFRRLYEACMERGLPIGCAPNVHVSLVMLPEECRTLSPRRFPVQRMKLAAMATAFGYQFRRRTRQPRAQSPVA